MEPPGSRGKNRTGNSRKNFVAFVFGPPGDLLRPGAIARGRFLPRSMSPEVFTRPTYHHEYSTEQIESMSGLRAPSRAAQEPGLTLFEYEVSSQYEMSEQGRSPNGPLLIWAKSIDVNFSITRMEVYVA